MNGEIMALPARDWLHVLDPIPRWGKFSDANLNQHRIGIVLVHADDGKRIALSCSPWGFGAWCPTGIDRPFTPQDFHLTSDNAVMVGYDDTIRLLTLVKQAIPKDRTDKGPLLTMTLAGDALTVTGARTPWHGTRFTGNNPYEGLPDLVRKAMDVQTVAAFKTASLIDAVSWCSEWSDRQSPGVFLGYVPDKGLDVRTICCPKGILSEHVHEAYMDRRAMPDSERPGVAGFNHANLRIGLDWMCLEDDNVRMSFPDSPAAVLLSSRFSIMALVMPYRLPESVDGAPAVLADHIRAWSLSALTKPAPDPAPEPAPTPDPDPTPDPIPDPRPLRIPTPQIDPIPGMTPLGFRPTPGPAIVVNRLPRRKTRKVDVPTPVPRVETPEPEPTPVVPEPDPVPTPDPLASVLAGVLPADLVSAVVVALGPVLERMVSDAVSVALAARPEPEPSRVLVPTVTPTLTLVPPPVPTPTPASVLLHDDGFWRVDGKVDPSGTRCLLVHARYASGETTIRRVNLSMGPVHDWSSLKIPSDAETAAMDWESRTRAA